MRRPSCCCTVFHPHRGCGSGYCRSWQIDLPDRPRLSRLRSQQRTVNIRIRLHVRPARADHGRVCIEARPRQLCSVLAGLWRPSRLPTDAISSRKGAWHHYSERCIAQQGLSPLWDARRRYWADPAGELDNLKANFISLEATRPRHIRTSPHPERYDPDSWSDEYAFLSRLGVASYPRWQ